MFRMQGLALAVGLILSQGVHARDDSETPAPLDDATASAQARAYSEAVVDAAIATKDVGDLLIAFEILSFAYLHGEHADAAAVRADALLRDALAHASDDIVTGWRLLHACHRRPSVCSPNDALARVQSIDADNAMAWLAGLRDADVARADALLAHAAQASRATSRFGEAVRSSVAAYSRVPPPSTPGSSDDASITRQEQVFIHGLTLAAASMMPPYQPLMHACRDAAPATPRHRHCQRVASLLLETSDTAIDRILGARVASAVADTAQARENARTACRDIAWLQSKGGEVADAGGENPEALLAYVRVMLAPDGGEVAALRAMLDHKGIAIEPLAEAELPMCESVAP